VELTFLPAYFSTRFWVEEPARSLTEFGVILSGFATTGQVWDAPRNRQSDLALESLLRSHSQCILVRLIGYSPSLDHAEPSWLVDCQDPAKRAYVGRFSDRLDWLDSETMRKCLQGDGPVRFGA
jgi:hypothetical protein